MKWIAVKYIFWGFLALILESYRRSPFVVLPSLVLVWPITSAILLITDPRAAKRWIIDGIEEEMAWNKARNYKPGWASRKKLALVHELR